MAEKKPGFFKRLFRFGRSKEEEPDPAEEQAKLAAEQEAAEQAAAAEAEQAAVAKAEEEAAAKAEQERVAAQEARLAEERAQAEAEARLKAEQAAQKAAEEKAAAEKAAAEQEAAEKQAAERARAEEQAREEEERKAEEARIAEEDAKAAEQAKREAEEEARLKAEQAAQKAEEERLIAEKMAAEKAAAEKLAAEQAKAQEEARLRAEEEERLKEEEAARVEAVRLAEEAAPTEVSEPEPEPEPEQPKKKSWFARMRDGLSRSSSQLTENITAVFTKRKLDEDTLQDLEDILIQADLGVETAVNITDALASQRMGKDITDEEVREFMADEIEKVLDPVAAQLELDLDHVPHVILVVGVNGSGKTTTIGKMSQKLYDAGFSTLLVAGDTFRAAAIEQLKIWGDRTQSPVLSRPLGSDAAGLAFDAYDQAKEEGRDVMLMDTAGRLQNKTELMDELEKIIRVLRKQDPTAPHTVLLTLDATTGQNALNQVEIFKDVAGVNGLVMTKMDGTARGGIMVAIANKFKLPVYFIGVGEQVEDLEPFEAREFARSIAGLE